MSGPKVLLYDIETFPNISYTWGKWEQNVIQFVKEWELASIAYKWLEETEQPKCFSRRTLSEKDLVGKLREVLDEADIVIAHNGDEFDLKKAKAKFIQFNFPPLTLNRSIDTKKIAKSQFAFNSNSLNDLGVTLKLGKKLDTGGFDLWLKCMAGDRTAWATMEKYNKQDVILLEKVYLKLRAWAPTHPNLSLFNDRPGCPVCGCERVHSNGFRVTTKTKQHRFRCANCGHSFIGKKDKKDA